MKKKEYIYLYKINRGSGEKEEGGREFYHIKKNLLSIYSPNF